LAPVGVTMVTVTYPAHDVLAIGEMRLARLAAIYFAAAEVCIIGQAHGDRSVVHVPAVAAVFLLLHLSACLCASLSLVNGGWSKEAGHSSDGRSRRQGKEEDDTAAERGLTRRKKKKKTTNNRAVPMQVSVP
jgi:hypothetical protein